MEPALSAHHLETVKDLLLLKFLVERGGEMAMTYQEVLDWGQQYHGYAVMLLGGADRLIVRVRTPEASR